MPPPGKARAAATSSRSGVSAVTASRSGRRTLRGIVGLLCGTQGGLGLSDLGLKLGGPLAPDLSLPAVTFGLPASLSRLGVMGA